MTTRTVPADFDQFWEDLAARARAVTPDCTREPIGPGIELIRYTSLDGFRVGAWLVLPGGDSGADVPVTSVVVNVHGYGGRGQLEPEFVPAGAACLYPAARGLPELSLDAAIPVVTAEHVVHGIESRESYVLGGCTADTVFCALNALTELLGRPLGERHGGLRVGLYGGSFGGGIAALGAPWDDRIDAVALQVPTFGNNPERVAVDCTGSTAAVAAHLLDHPEAWPVLDYFDAATAAARITVPTLIAPALRDPGVPPVGQWAVARAVPEALRTITPLTAGHVDATPALEREKAAFAGDVRDLLSAE